MATDGQIQITDEEALAFHAEGRPDKMEIAPTKPLTTQRNLSLIYSPGGAVLGLGYLGALAAKPVMEGKAVLSKRFADIDGIDLDVDTRDVDEFVNCVRFLGASFGGINLEDIAAPAYFVIEDRVRGPLDIPVFHDDQHGTTIIGTAGLINALDLTGRTLGDLKLVSNGATASAIAFVELLNAMGLPREATIMCDSRGVIYEGREADMNQWKSAHAAKTEARTLAETVKGADVLLGLSVKGSVDKDMVASMARRPIIFALANPDPEITPEAVREVRDDAIIATGRSDYPNQVNNVLVFPYIFRGALDVCASTLRRPGSSSSSTGCGPTRGGSCSPRARAWRSTMPRYKRTTSAISISYTNACSARAHSTSIASA
jgi:malate dehydrogenase (oxaloacetate-decarboxylating)(NADP+)